MLSAAALLLVMASRVDAKKTCTAAMQECVKEKECEEIHLKFKEHCPDAKTACKMPKCKKLIDQAQKLKSGNGQALFDCDCKDGDQMCKDVQVLTKCD